MSCEGMYCTPGDVSPLTVSTHEGVDASLEVLPQGSRFDVRGTGAAGMILWANWNLPTGSL
jgi:hypothetical protein